MRMSRILAAAAAFAASGSAFGAFTLNSGNATFTMPASAAGLFPTSSLSAADFRPEGGTTTDQVFYYNWGVRQPGASNAGLTAAGASSITEAGTGTDTYTHTIINGGSGTTGQSRYNAVTTIRLTDGALPGAARLDSTLVFTASPNNLAPATYQLFHVVDNDFNGSFGNDQYNVTDTTAVRGTVADTLLTTPGVFGQFEGLGASRYEVSATGTIRGRINGGLADLANTTSFLGDGGYGFQWTVTLAPGESYTARSSYNIVVPEPAIAGMLFSFVPVLLRRRK